MEWQFIIPYLLILVLVSLIIIRVKASGPVISSLRAENEFLKISNAKLEEKFAGVAAEKATMLEELYIERAKHFELSKSNESLKSYYRSQEEKLKEQREETAI